MEELLLCPRTYHSSSASYARAYVHTRSNFSYRKYFVVLFIQCRKYFVIFNFVVLSDYENILNSEYFRIYGTRVDKESKRCLGKD